MTPARTIWQQIEAVHAVVYFASEPAEAAKLAGLRGFWMGYFGFRAAPLGAVGPAAIVATFANFAPTPLRCQRRTRLLRRSGATAVAELHDVA